MISDLFMFQLILVWFSVWIVNVDFLFVVMDQIDLLMVEVEYYFCVVWSVYVWVVEIYCDNKNQWF